MEESCRAHGAEYVRFPPSRRDTRARQRNLGAQRAVTDWVLFQDDDDDIIAEFDHAEFDRVSRDCDFLWDGEGVNIVYHRRENFLRLGGYPEDMVQGWLTTLSWLVRATSVGNLEGAVYKRLESLSGKAESKKMHAQKAASNFWIGLTFLPWLERTPPGRRRSVVTHTALYYLRLWEERDYRATAPLGLLLYTFGLLLGLPWHWTRKAYDHRYKENIRKYRASFPGRATRRK